MKKRQEREREKEGERERKKERIPQSLYRFDEVIFQKKSICFWELFLNEQIDE
jgi:hypothetical protein